MIQNKVGVGVAVIVKHPTENKILLQKRKGSIGANTWSIPGGHLEFKEKAIDCAIRETKEETGLDVNIVEKLGYVESVFENDTKHYITLYFRAELKNPAAEPKVMEPDKCYLWKWFDIADILDGKVSPLFEPFKNGLGLMSTLFPTNHNNIHQDYQKES